MSDSSRASIVVTGVGLACSLGLDAAATWRNVLAKTPGLRPLTAMESPLPTGVPDGGQAIDLPPDYFPDLPRESRYLRWTIAQALREANAEKNLPYDPSRCGLMLGTTLHGIRAAGRYLRSGRYSDLKDFLAADVLRLSTRDFHLAGPQMTGCSACSSSLGSIALGVTMLQTGQLDLVIAGGYDTISEYVYGGFNSLRLVANGPLRPFAKDRQGMKLAEGYGIVILERETDATARGAKIVATIAGFGESADAHHLTQPQPQGEGAARAMQAALEQANLTPADIDLIAAHATGTPDNDAAEFAALSRVFGERLPSIPVVAYKSHLGHTLGGAGAVELILSMMALNDQITPPCANIRAGDIEFVGLNVATDHPRPTRIRHTLNTSLGFGGANTCMILSPPPLPPGEGRGEELKETRKAERGTRSSQSLITTFSQRERGQELDVLITGIGVVLPGAIGNEAFVRLLDAPPAEKSSGAFPAITDDAIAHLINARRVRRMSDYVKLSLAATMVAIHDAKVFDIPSFTAVQSAAADRAALPPASAILGSTHGSANYSEQYYGQIVREGVLGANPMLFAEGVPNAAAAHLSMMLSVRGACQTIIGSRTAGIDALRLAATRIAVGQWDRAIVSAAEEFSGIVFAAYQDAGLARSEKSPAGFVCSAGAVSLILESRRSLESRRGRARGTILAAAAESNRPTRTLRAATNVLASLGRPQTVIGSANHTWLDRVERAAVATALPGADLTSLYDRIGETFSVAPLAAIASQLLRETTDRRDFAVLATDYTGLASSALLRPATPADH